MSRPGELRCLETNTHRTCPGELFAQLRVLALAAAHRRIVDRYWDESRKMRDLQDQEEQLLSRAQGHCTQAGNLYQELGVFQTAVDQYKMLLKRCGEIQVRMEEMKMPAGAVR